MLPMHVADLEGIARDIHDSTGGLLPVDAFKLAALCGLQLRPTPGSGGSLDIDAGVIRYPSRARLVRQHGVVAHELGHWALHQAGEDHTAEWAARYLAGALLLPQAAFVRDATVCDWDLEELRERHPHASAEMVVVRMTRASTSTSRDGYVTIPLDVVFIVTYPSVYDDLRNATVRGPETRRVLHHPGARRSRWHRRGHGQSVRARQA